MQSFYTAQKLCLCNGLLPICAITIGKD